MSSLARRWSSAVPKTTTELLRLSFTTVITPLNSLLPASFPWLLAPRAVGNGWGPGAAGVAVGRTGKGYVAFQDRCTHKGGPLSDGVLICGTVQCPWHGSQFDVHTGEVKAGPAEGKIETYDVHDQKKIGA